MSDGKPAIVVLGAGRMGQAILTGLIAAGWNPTQLAAIEAHSEAAAQVRALGVAVRSAPQALAHADLLVVAVKPHQVVSALAEVSDSLGNGVAVLSLAAGITTATVSANVPAGVPVMRVMPNTPALVGMGMSAISAGPECPRPALDLAMSVLGSIGKVVEVPESAQNAVTAVSGSGPAYVFYVAEAMIEAGVQLGLPRTLAHELTVQTLLGAATMLARLAEHPSVLRENVTSPGGSTAAALHILDEAAVRAAFANAMRACRDRAAELAGD